MLRRLPAESRRGLQPTLDALIEPQVKIDTSRFTLPMNLKMRWLIFNMLHIFGSWSQCASNVGGRGSP